MGLKNFSTVLYRLWRGGFKKVAFTNFRPDRHILSRADGRCENLQLGGWQNLPPGFNPIRSGLFEVLSLPGGKLGKVKKFGIG